MQLGHQLRSALGEGMGEGGFHNRVPAGFQAGRRLDLCPPPIG
jgi:hypothetical protein